MKYYYTFSIKHTEEEAWLAGGVVVRREENMGFEGGIAIIIICESANR